MAHEDNNRRTTFADMKCNWLKVRYIQAFIVFLNAMSSGITRFIMSLAILSMTEKSRANVPVYDWDKKTQGFILAASIWGETLAQFAAGIIINKIGSKIMLSTSNIANGILMILLPTIANYGGYIGTCFLRFLQGVFLSFVFPSTHAFISKWAPYGERSRMGTFIYTGCVLATVYCMPVSSLILRSNLGWPWMLYIFGFQSMLVGVIWQIYGTKCPSEHKTISIEERNFIEKSLNENENTRVKKIPWREIFTSKPVYAIIICHIGCEWSYTVIHNEMPSYFRKALGVDLENAGLILALADFGALCVMIVACVTADFLCNRGYLSLTIVRKLFNSIATFGVSFSLLVIICLPLDVQIQIPITLLILSVSLEASCNSGFFMNHIDISPNFSDVLFGISSNATKIVAMSSAIITGYIVSDMTNQNLWKIIFGICALSYFLGNLVFFLLGTGEVQSWNYEKSTEKLDNKNKEPLLELKDMTNSTKSEKK